MAGTSDKDKAGMVSGVFGDVGSVFNDAAIVNEHLDREGAMRSAWNEFIMDQNLKRKQMFQQNSQFGRQADLGGLDYLGTQRAQAAQAANLRAFNNKMASF
jgi:hypothetical protein